MWCLNHCRMARVALACIVGLTLPVMFAPRAGAQTVGFDPRVAEIQARQILADIQIGELKSQLAVLQQQNNYLWSEVASLRNNDALQRTLLEFNNKLEDEIVKANTTNAGAIQSLKTELANIRAGQTGSAVKAPFDVVGSSGQPLFRVVERGGGEVLIMRQGAPMIELGLGSKGNPGLRIAGSGGVEENVAFVGRLGDGGVVNVHPDSGAASAGMEARGGMTQLAVGDTAKTAASLRLVDGRRPALVIFDPAGNAAVSATTNPSGLGEVVVQAGPDAVAWMKVADDLTGGSNCAVRKRGLWCVGINLPLTLGGK